MLAEHARPFRSWYRNIIATEDVSSQDTEASLGISSAGGSVFLAYAKHLSCASLWSVRAIVGGRWDNDANNNGNGAVVGGLVAYVGFGPQGRGGAGGGRWPAVPRARPPGEEVGVRTCTGH